MSAVTQAPAGPVDAPAMTASRVRASIPVEFEAGDTTGSGKIENVGFGGLFVGTKAIPEVGEPVCLSFRFPGGEPISLMGLVWWTTQDAAGGRGRTPGFGFRLIEDHEDYEQAVGRMLS